MKRPLVIILSALATIASADVTNLVSDVKESRAWKRNYATVSDDGTINDPSGRLIPYSEGVKLVEAAQHVRSDLSKLIVSYDTEIQRLIRNTNRAERVTERIYIAGDEEPSMEPTNLLCHIVSTRYDGTNDLLEVWYSPALKAAPKVDIRYRLENVEYWANGNWPEGAWTNTAHTVDGFEGCHLLSVPRPPQVGNLILRPNVYPFFGRPDTGFDFQRRVFYFEGPSVPTSERAKLPVWIDWTTNITFHTGIFTNIQGKVETYNNGVFTGDMEEQE